MADTISVSIIIVCSRAAVFACAAHPAPCHLEEGGHRSAGVDRRGGHFVFGMVLEQLINAAMLGTGSSAVSAFLLGHRGFTPCTAVFRLAFWRRPHASSYIERC